MIVLKHLQDILQYPTYTNTKLFIHENSSENIVWETVAIFV